jgi:hypothetical protein
MPNDKIFDKNATREFLLFEYQECFNHMRHYDSVEIDFIKFSFSGYIALVGGSFALLQYLKGTPQGKLYVATVLFLGFLGGIILLAFAVRNRSYYVIVARQVNTIRKYFLENSELDFINHNKCYLNDKKPQNFNPKSTYTFLITLLILFNSVILSGAVWLLVKYLMAPIFIWLIGIATIIISAVLQFKFSIDYLRKCDNKSADEAIFT